MKTPMKKAQRGIKLKPSEVSTTISHCNFTGSLDGETCKTIQAVAAATLENAKTLTALAQAFTPAPLLTIEPRKED